MTHNEDTQPPAGEPEPTQLALAAIAQGRCPCIGCGIPFAPPFAADELAMMRMGRSGVSGYCGGCLGARGPTLPRAEELGEGGDDGPGD